MPLLVVLFASMSDSSASGAEFTGRVLVQMQSELDTLHLFVKGDRYLLRGTMDSMTINALADRTRGIVDAWTPSDTQYHEASLKDMSAAFIDPFAAIDFVAAMCENGPKKEGTETIEGYACDKYVLRTKDGTEAMTYWVARALDFPIKIAEPAEGAMSLTVDQIKETAVNASLLQLPHGMVLAVEPGEGAPAWAKDIPGAPIIKVPYSRIMAAGEIIRVKPRIGQKIEVRCDHTENGTQFCGSSFKNGEPDGNIMMGTFNLDSGQNWTERFEPFAAKDDEIVIRMNKGRGLITIQVAKKDE